MVILWKLKRFYWFNQFFFKSLNSHIVKSSLSPAKKQLLWDNRLDYRDEDKPNININDEQQSRHKQLPRDIIKNHQTRNFLRIYYEEFFESGGFKSVQSSQLGKNVNSDQSIYSWNSACGSLELMQRIVRRNHPRSLNQSRRDSSCWIRISNSYSSRVESITYF